MFSSEKVEHIARVAHEANRAYCATLGDGSQSAWEETPNWQRESAIKGVQFHLAAHAEGETPNPAASHNAWLEEKQAAGWSFGPVKDATLKQHPCFVAYTELPIEQRLKDYIFGSIVEAFVRAADNE